MYWNCFAAFYFLQDLLSWTKDKSEVETVDLILKLREKLVSDRTVWLLLHYLLVFSSMIQLQKMKAAFMKRSEA